MADMPRIQQLTGKQVLHGGSCVHPLNTDEAELQLQTIAQWYSPGGPRAKCGPPMKLEWPTDFFFFFGVSVI